AGGGRATPETTLHSPSARCARELGPGWKLSPCIAIDAGETAVLGDIEGPGCIRHIWITLDPKFYRDLVFRIQWDNAPFPSVEVPIGDFFCCAWGVSTDLAAIPINVNPKGGLNCYLPMPFRSRAFLTVTNTGASKISHFFYTINYTLEELPPRSFYLHTQFRRALTQPFKTDYTILDTLSGRGHYVGTFMAWQQKIEGWWGEGEIKIFLDDDLDFPTICGTGTEDYFGGAWCFGRNYTAAFLGYQLVAGEDGKAGAKHTMYRFHLPDPIHFKNRLRVTMQALGWQSEGRYLPLEDDIASVAYYYLETPTPLPSVLPDLETRQSGCEPPL
ncbi:MAG: DUF2961 domain-containing protein, partial [Bacteroidetes bacterium]|nr:DUF2961 domain-containing protein [Bacteroidota bacterium]